MKNLIVVFTVALGLGLAATASAEPATEAQIVEVCQLLAAPATLLERKRAEATDLQPEDCVKIEVDYDLTLAEIARWISSYIRDGSFPAPRGKGKVTKEVCLFKFNPSVTSGEVKKRIEAGGDFLVADLWELNSLRTPYPQRRLSLIGLGSVWRGPDGHLIVPTLSNVLRIRYELGLSYFVCVWPSTFRFPAVRK